MSLSFRRVSSVVVRIAKESRRQEAFRLVKEEKSKESNDRKKKKRRCAQAFAPLLYRGNLGTPKEGQLGAYFGPSSTPAPSAPAAPSGGTSSSGGGGVSSSIIPPSRSRVLHELKKAMGLVEFVGAGGGTVAWQGFAVPNPISMNMRSGGPTIGGPGFAHNDDGPGGGIYNFQKSPGLGFRTQQGWQVWKAALEVMSTQKTLPKGAILQAAFQRAGVKMSQMDPSEVRLLEMGIDFYLSDPVPYAAKRGSGFGPSGGSTNDPNMVTGGSA